MATSLWETWNTVFTTELVSQPGAPVIQGFELSLSISSSPTRADEVLVHWDHQWCGGVRLGPETLLQIHGLQGEQASL